MLKWQQSKIVVYERYKDMTKDIVPALFEGQKIRTTKNEDGEVVYCFSDILAVASDTSNPRHEMVNVKNALKKQGIEMFQIMEQLKFRASDGKLYRMWGGTRKQILRALQEVHTRKAALVKAWLVDLAEERLQEIENPSKGVENSIRRWKQMGKSAPWIAERVKGIGVRNVETDVLKAHGISAPKDFAHFTDRTNVAVYGHTAKVEKAIRKVPASANLRDASSITELSLLGFHESACAMGIENRNAQGKAQIDGVYDVVGGIVSIAREKLLEAFGSASLAPGEIAD